MIIPMSMRGRRADIPMGGEFPTRIHTYVGAIGVSFDTFAACLASKPPYTRPIINYAVRLVKKDLMLSPEAL